MTSTELWKMFAQKNPQFEGTGNVTLSCDGLRKLFDQTYDHAHAQGFRNGKAFAELHAPKDESLFGKIFGAR